MRIMRFFRESLYHRLVLYFTLLMMIPLSVGGTLIYMASDVRISDGAMALAQEVVSKESENIEKVLSDMESAAKQTVRDQSIQSLLAQLREENAPKEELISSLNLRLKQISSMYTGLDGIYLYLDDHSVARSRYYSARPGHVAISLSDMQYAVIRNHEDMQWISSEHGSLLADNMGNAVLSVARLVPLGETGTACGIVVVEVRQVYLEKILGHKLAGNGFMLMTAQDRNILLAESDADQAAVNAAIEQINKNPGSEKISLLDRVIFCEELSVNGWMVIGVVMRQALRSDSNEILMMFVLSALLIFLLTTVVARYLANYELEPIRRIQRYVREIENGTFGGPLKPVRNDEIGSLAISTQEMSQKIGRLLETVKAEQERLRTAEFRALQAQINPHFLYNSLDSINWLVRKGDMDKATEMLSALTTFFRIGLSKGRDIITVREEIDHVRSYLIIQKIRYDRQFEYTIYVDPNAENYFVPKLMLQPLVENALYHGIKLCDRKCMLIIQVVDQGDSIQMEVLDNGAGMDAETLEAVRAAMKHTGRNQTNSYGVVNVNDRIQILAGPEYGLTLTSEKGMGTSARIVLPKTLKGV